ncbi:MAG: hypothetical protein ABEJ89_00995 [Haloarculaceae archaeon]
MPDQELNVDELRSELDQIKDAMGLQERYESTGQQWLLFAVLVAVAAGISQYVMLARLSGWWYSVVWAVVVGGGWYVGNRLIDTRVRGSTAGKPSVVFLYAAVFLATIPTQLVFAPFLRDLGYVPRSAMILGSISVFLGLAYLLIGNLLRAYYIRRRDRVVLYVGGLWLIVLGVAVADLPPVREWGYAAFGAGYVVYALAAYAVLRGESGE